MRFSTGVTMLRLKDTGPIGIFSTAPIIGHGRFSGNGPSAALIAADIVRFEDGKLAEHWDVLQEEATKAQSKSGLPMFGDRFPD